MEQVIQFLEEYWGVSIAGGVTVGTLLTFIVVQVKSILQFNALRTQSTGQLSNSNQLVKDIAQKYNALESRHQELEAKDRYLEQVNLATFKALSYIVIASKLPIEDKLSLQEEFNKLMTVKPVVSEKSAGATPALPTPVVSQEVFTQTVETVVKAAGDLLSKYVGAK
jgi:uncharacterized membrane protein YcgQ (UPF0703/DUF1980 family)